MTALEPGVQLTASTAAAMERLSTSPSKPAMTEQHKATPEQWAQIERTAQLIHGDGCSALLELRARVEALEELHKAVVDLNKRFSLDLLVARVELLEATQHAHIDTSRLRVERDQIRQDLAKPARVFATAEVAPIVVPSSPTGSMVERVGNRIKWGIDAELDEEGIARAAILEVAAWLRTQSCPGTARLLEQEATR